MHEDFVTEWTMPAGDLILTFPGFSTTTYDIDWGDGESSMGVSGSTDHNYGTTMGARTYTVRASRTITGFHLAVPGNVNAVNAAKLTNVSQWGTANWESMLSTFHGARMMTMSATDAPNLSAVTDMRQMFFGARLFNADISGWDVSGVTQMTDMFLFADDFDQNLGRWYVEDRPTSTTPM
ncbi:MAG: BspA family leucine-rich repeat surface protein, partial [Methylococcales symbiont of Hymedesmia sp. n. MRB-2018]